MSPPPPINPLRIAVLETDQVFPERNGYGGLYTALLHAGADALRWPRDRLQISVWDVVNARGESIAEYPRLEDVDAVLISGSRISPFENHAWILRLVEFTREVLAQTRVRLIGVCFGHQIIGRTLGANVLRGDHAFEMSVINIALTARGKELFDGKDVLSIMSMHRDIVARYPPDVEALGSTPHTEVQAMYAHRRLITVQGHPEFNQEIMTEILHKRRLQNFFDEPAFQDAIGRVGDPQDGVVVAKAFLRFLVEE